MKNLKEIQQNALGKVDRVKGTAEEEKIKFAAVKYEFVNEFMRR